MNVKTFFLLIFSLISLQIFSKEIQPLSDYVEKYGDTDPAAEYVAKRCAALSMAIANWIPEEDDLYTAFFDDGMFWFEMAVLAHIELMPRPDLEKEAEDVMDSILKIKLSIEEIMAQNQKSGNALMGTSLEDDMVTCRQFQNTANE
tara:strand:- start:1354 stop:1791 length:438 start_codon:yes stop_codon:yes gene_type:complete